jgi:hypothetical protein
MFCFCRGFLLTATTTPHKTASTLLPQAKTAFQ